MAAQAKREKGKYSLTAPRVAATLADGTPGLVVNPVGKGEVIWLPNHLIEPPPNRRSGPEVTSPPLPAPQPAAPDTGFLNAPPSSPTAAAPINVDHSTPLQRYYLAIAGYMQEALVQVRGTDQNMAGAEAVKLALRRTPRGNLVLLVSNTTDRAAAVAPTVMGAQQEALDLASETELPTTIRGDGAEISLIIPAHGYKLIAFAATRKALEDERNTPKAIAHLR
jgi:hypothetical protein